MSATGLSTDYIKGWRLWSDLHYPVNFEATVVNELLDEVKSRGASVQPLSEMSILEVGCGDGRVIREFAPLSKCIIGVDTNSKMIEFLKSDLARMRIAYFEARTGSGDINVSIEEMSGTDLQFPDNKFDLVLYPWSLHQIPDKERALTEAKRVLVDGGHIVVFGLLPGGEYENTVQGIGLDPGPQVDALEAYETPLLNTFGNIRASRSISKLASDKEFGFQFKDYENALSAWQWAMTNWHERELNNEESKVLEDRIRAFTHQDRIFMNICGKAYMCSK